MSQDPRVLVRASGWSGRSSCSPLGFVCFLLSRAAPRLAGVGVVGDGTGCGFRLLPLLRFLPSKAQLRDIPLRPSLEQLVQTGRQAPLESLPQGNIQVRDPPVGTDALFPPPAGAGEQSCVGLRTRERFRRYRGHLSGRVPIGWEWPIPEHSIELWEE